MSVQCCPLTSNDGPSARVKTTEIRKAARAHVCCECRDAIPVGSRHEYTRALWEDSWDTYRTCLSCVEIRNHFACDGWIYEHVWEDIEQNFFPDMRAGGPCMDGLSPEAKARLFERCLAWRMERGS